MSADDAVLSALCQELHDNIAQSLAAVNYMLQNLIEQADYPPEATRAAL
ncbi:histidine kinase, partial [bacterium]|nr:histidine kinase [bacterium]